MAGGVLLLPREDSRFDVVFADGSSSTVSRPDLRRAGATSRLADTDDELHIGDGTPPALQSEALYSQCVRLPQLPMCWKRG